MTMNAKQARELARNNLQGPVIEPHIAVLNKHIKSASLQGRFNIDPWMLLSKYRTPSPTIDEQKAIQQHYCALGYRFHDYPNPDPGHPASRAYTTMSWE